VDDSWDLRHILSQNIRNSREALHMTQAKLAEHADISLPYMADIEHCKTWVSDKTLVNLARALHMKAHELLIPPQKADSAQSGEQVPLRQIAKIIKETKRSLRQTTEDTLDDLMARIIRLYSEPP
jgi:transcriptional regulator with XRE-family HTH domain